jgi:putative toxin-antitoxin system antitoxin component (TIGR02293 family)
MNKPLRKDEPSVIAEPLTAYPAAPPATASENRQVVRSFIRSSSHAGSGHEPAAASVIRRLEAGLPVRELDDLQSGLDLPMEKVGSLLGISKATLHRRKAAGRLDTSESDRVVRFARLLGKAVAVLESAGHARQWLSSPQFGLGGVIPLEYARTEVGAREVENLLGRIEHGVYS